MRIAERLEKHLAFVHDRFKTKGKIKHKNNYYLFPVMTKQETDLIINELLSVDQIDKESFQVTYSDKPQQEYVGSRDEYVLSDAELEDLKKRFVPKKRKKKHAQRQLF